MASTLGPGSADRYRPTHGLTPRCAPPRPRAVPPWPDAGRRLVLAAERRSIRSGGPEPPRGGERLRGPIAGPHRAAPGVAVRGDEGPHQGDRPVGPLSQGPPLV